MYRHVEFANKEEADRCPCKLKGSAPSSNASTPRGPGTSPTKSASVFCRAHLSCPGRSKTKGGDGTCNYTHEDEGKVKEWMKDASKLGIAYSAKKRQRPKSPARGEGQ